MSTGRGFRNLWRHTSKILRKWGSAPAWRALPVDFQYVVRFVTVTQWIPPQLPDEQGVALEYCGDAEHGDFGIAGSADGINSHAVHLGVDALIERPADRGQLERVDVEFEDGVLHPQAQTLESAG